VSRRRADHEVREPRHGRQQYSRPLPRADVEPVSTSYPAQPPGRSTPDVDDELARLKREMGG
jgi:hypothetical protein